jgi:hypothetical protein
MPLAPASSGRPPVQANSGRPPARYGLADAGEAGRATAASGELGTAPGEAASGEVRPAERGAASGEVRPAERGAAATSSERPPARRGLGRGWPAGSGASAGRLRGGAARSERAMVRSGQAERGAAAWRRS